MESGLRYAAEEQFAELLSRIAELPSDENPFVELATPVAPVPPHAAQGPLRGVPIGVKDVIAVEGTRMRAGTSFLEIENREDAGVVAMLRAAGALIVGTTRTHELASGTTGLNPHDPDGGLRNPWDSARVGGGSSIGSAVSVATGLTPIALGTDTGGSVRAPAALCGVVGFKPTYGLLPLHGVYPVASTMDHVGILASSIDELTRAARTLLPPETEGEGPSAAVTRLAVLESDIQDLDDRVQDAFEAQMDAWRRSGLEVDVVPFSSHEHIYDVSGTILLYESSRSLELLLEEHGSRMSAPVRDRLLQGREMTAREYAEALAERRLVISRFRQVFDEYDLVAGPTVPIEAPLVDRAGDGRLVSRIVRNTRLGNLTGAPAISMPRRHGDSHIGVQYTVLPGADWHLLNAVKSLAETSGS